TASPSSSEYKWPLTIAGKSLDEWIKELKHRDPSVRENAIRTLPMFGPSARKAVSAVIDMANNDREDVSLRVNSCISLMTLEIPNREESAAIRALVKRMTLDQQAVVRLHAAMALGRYEESTDRKEAIPGLITSTKDSGSWEIRKAAINSLARVAKDKQMGPDPKATVAVLEVLNREYCAKVRLEAVMALGAMGKPNNEMTRQEVVIARQHEVIQRDKTIAGS